MRVKFTNGNTAASPTLNVNGTGAVSIMKFGVSAVSSFAWNAGLVVTFVYDGTNWLMDSRPESVGLLNGGIEIPSTTNLDSVTDTGWYYWGNTAPINAPIAYGNAITNAGMCVDTNGIDIHQTAYRGGTPNIPLKWERYKHGGNAWSKWYEQSLESMPADTTLHVNATSGDDSNDGLTARTALKTIAAALAKVPADQAGRYAQILLADGTYSALSISNRNISLLLFGKETGSTADNIKIPGGTITDNGNSCILISNVTFTAALSLYGHNRLTQFIVSSCVFDGGGLDARGPFTRINACSFKNLPSNSVAINAGSGYAEVYSLNIANSCDIGINAAGATVIVNTNTLTNNATTPYRTTYSGRIFVGGRTYKENPSKVTLFQTQTSLGTGTTDITISDDYRKYTFLEFMFSKASSSTRAILYIHSNSIAVSAWYPIAPGGTVVTLRISNVSGTYTQVRISNLSITGYYLEAINAIP